jgi:hypothetical protein
MQSRIYHTHLLPCVLVGVDVADYFKGMPCCEVKEKTHISVFPFKSKLTVIEMHKSHESFCFDNVTLVYLLAVLVQKAGELPFCPLDNFYRDYINTTIVEIIGRVFNSKTVSSFSISLIPRNLISLLIA